MCVGGVSLPPEYADSCGKQVTIDYTTLIVGVVIGGVVVVAAIGGIGFLWWRNKKLYVAYRNLHSHNVPMEPQSTEAEVRSGLLLNCFSYQRLEMNRSNVTFIYYNKT